MGAAKAIDRKQHMPMGHREMAPTSRRIGSADAAPSQAALRGVRDRNTADSRALVGVAAAAACTAVALVDAVRLPDEPVRF